MQAGIPTLSPGTQRQKMQTRPSRGFTPPIKFTAGTLNFIGNVNLVVKKYACTHTMGPIRDAGELRLGVTHPELSKGYTHANREINTG